MPLFFVKKEQIASGVATVTGDDAHHISRSLRMAVGETLTLSDMEGSVYRCTLTDFLPDRVLARVEEVTPCLTEPPYRVELYQGLPKGDKLDAIIQKAVECGVASVTTFESEYCVVRAKAEAEEKKLERRRRIALEAAKQSRRGSLPQIHPTLSFAAMLEAARTADICLFCYEGEGTVSLFRVLEEAKGSLDLVKMPRVSVVVGSEGGFSKNEAKAAEKAGLIPISLGKRILRTETAPTFVLSALSYALELPLEME